MVATKGVTKEFWNANIRLSYLSWRKHSSVAHIPLRMHCIDRPGVLESSDACTFHGSCDSYILGPARAASIEHTCYGSAIYTAHPWSKNLLIVVHADDFIISNFAYTHRISLWGIHEKRTYQCAGVNPKFIRSYVSLNYTPNLI